LSIAFASPSIFARRVIDARNEVSVSTSSLFGHASKSFFCLPATINLKLIVNPSRFGADATIGREACRRFINHFRRVRTAFAEN
jgi:hypothetical protein